MKIGVFNYVDFRLFYGSTLSGNLSISLECGDDKYNIISHSETYFAITNSGFIQLCDNKIFSRYG